MKSSLPPASGALLESLYAEPQTLACLAAALRFCNHPESGQALDTVTPSGEPITVHLCVMCGATSTTDRGSPAGEWKPVVIAQVITRDRLVEYEHTMLSLAQIWGCLDHTRNRLAEGTEARLDLDEICHAVSDLLKTPTMQAGERIATVAARR